MCERSMCLGVTMEMHMPKPLEIVDGVATGGLDTSRTTLVVTVGPGRLKC